MENSDRLSQLFVAANEYGRSRQAFLDILDCSSSCRDPFAELSEELVLAWLGGELASSRVERGYDLTTPNGRRVQVKYLANPDAIKRINEHCVIFPEEADDYALCIYDGLQFNFAIVFPRESLAAVAAELKKRHGNTDRRLDVTVGVLNAIRNEPDRFLRYGVRTLMSEEIRAIDETSK